MLASPFYWGQICLICNQQLTGSLALLSALLDTWFVTFTVKRNKGFQYLKQSKLLPETYSRRDDVKEMKREILEMLSRIETKVDNRNHNG